MSAFHPLRTFEWACGMPLMRLLGGGSLASQAGENSDERQEYRRDVGTAGIVFLVVNGLIGSGIFALPELLHESAGFVVHR